MITEQQVREVFELVFAVRARWSKDFREFKDEFVKLGYNDLVFIDSYSAEDEERMPLLALVDYDAAAGPRIQENIRMSEVRQEQDKEWRRRQFEKLRQEFEG